DGRGGRRREPARLRRPGRVRLVGRLDGVHRVVAAEHARRGRRPARARVAGGGQGEVLDRGPQRGGVQRVVVRHAVLVHHRVQVVGPAVVDGPRPDRVAGRDQPLVVQERAPEGGLEEVVGDRVVGVAALVQVVVDGQGPGVVDAHGQADGVAAGDVPGLAALLERVLLLVEAVDQVAGAAAGQPGAVRDAVGGEGAARYRAGGRLGRDVVVDGERPVAEMAGEGRPGGGVGAPGRQGRRGQVDVVLEEALVRGAGLVDLDGLGPR